MTITETLRRLAEKAISGPWVSESSVTQSELDNGLAVIAVIPEVQRNGFDTPTRGMVAWVHSGAGACATDDLALATAGLIARCDPQTIIAMCAVVEAAERRREAQGEDGIEGWRARLAATRDLDAALEALRQVEG